MAIGLVVAALAVAYTMRNVSTGELLQSFRQVEWKYLAMSTLLMAATYAARTLRWQALVNPIKPVKAWALVSPLMVGFMAAVLPARAGEFVRAYLLGKSQNIPFASAFATIVVERLFDLAALLFLLAWLLTFHADKLAPDAHWNGISIETLAFQFGILAMGLVAGLMVFIYLLAFKRDLAMKVVGFFLRPLPDNWRDKLAHLIHAFGDGLEVVRSKSALLNLTLTTALVWGLIMLAYYPLYLAYGLQDASPGSIILLTLMICILITLLPTPAFLGSFQAGVLIALHEIMHEPEVAAVSFGFVAWGLNMIVVLAGALYFILHDHISIRKIAELDPDAG